MCFVFQTSEQDVKKIREEETDELREKVKTLEEMAEVCAQKICTIDGIYKEWF